MKIIGSEKLQTNINRQVVWQMEKLKNSFRFHLKDQPKIELFIEHDEMTGAGEAYEFSDPLNMLDIMKKLEELAPNFHSIQISEKIKLIRKRLPSSKGIEIINGGSRADDDFMKDPTLATINFLDFHDTFLTPKAECTHDSKETDTSVISLNSRIKNTGT